MAKMHNESGSLYEFQVYYKIIIGLCDKEAHFILLLLLYASDVSLKYDISGI